MPLAGPSHDEPTVAERLDSWKEIAAYLKRDVRTVRRWETTEQLPVHRHTHNRQATVYAYKLELDHWWEQRQPHLPPPAEPLPVIAQLAAPPQHRHTLIWGGLLIILVFAAAALLGWRYMQRTRTMPANRASTLPARLFAEATRENGKIRWIETGNEPFLLFLSSSGGELYAVGRTGVTIVDTASEQVVHHIPLPLVASALLSSDGRWLYVGTVEGGLHIINTATRKVEALHIGDTTRGLALSPDGETLYIAAGFSGLKRLLVAKRQLVDMTSVICPMNLALTPDGRRLYIAYQCAGPGGSPGHDSIDVIDTASYASVATITGLPNVGGWLSISPDGTELWANGHDACLADEYDHVGCPIVPGNVINVLRTSDHKLVRALGFPSAHSLPGFQEFVDDARTLVGGRSLQVFNTATLKSTEVLPLPANGSMAFTRDGRHAYLVSFTKTTPFEPPRRDLPLAFSGARIGVLDFTPHHCPLTPPGLTALWTGDGTANDAHDGLDATLENGAGFAPGMVGQAFQFDGIDDALAVPALGNLDLRSTFTFMAWMKRAGGAGKTTYLAEALSPNPGGTGWQLFLDANSRVVTCMSYRAGESTKAAGCIRSATPAPEGVWQHVGVIKTPERLQLILDGQIAEQGRSPLAGPMSLRRPQLRIAASLNGRAFYAGLLDEIGIYGRALQLEEIRRISAARSAARCY